LRVSAVKQGTLNLINVYAFLNVILPSNSDLNTLFYGAYKKRKGEKGEKLKNITNLQQKFFFGKIKRKYQDYLSYAGA
jgi:hypothetical protein